MVSIPFMEMYLADKQGNGTIRVVAKELGVDPHWLAAKLCCIRGDKNDGKYGRFRYLF